MEEYYNIFGSFHDYFSDDSPSSPPPPSGGLSTEFTKLFNTQILNQIQSNIKKFAKTHIKAYSPSQDYNKLKLRHSPSNLYTDPDFQAKNSSVFVTTTFQETLIKKKKLSSSGDVIWKRLYDIDHNARFATGLRPGLTTESELRICFNYADQGAIGNCWFVAAVGGLVGNADLFKKIVPFDNHFSISTYSGLFHFRFWIHGTWHDVVVDDYLPVSPDGRLIFCRNKLNANDFWCALLEKAYAKVNGSYEVLDGGLTTDALIDMSGGFEERYSLKKLAASEACEHERFWQVLRQAQAKRSVICCDIERMDEMEGKEREKAGLIRGHAYIVTSLRSIRRGNKGLYLLRCQNPWGEQKCEFKGNWSKGSSTWQLLSEVNQKMLLDMVKENGQFW